MPDPPRERRDASVAAREAKLQFVVAEYQWVAGLIRYYREVELKALGATGLLLSGVVAGFTALRAAEKDTAHEQALLLSIAAWVPAVSLMIVLMATLRGYRAVVYVRDRLHPLAARLAGDDHEVLAWEQDAQRLAFDVAAADRSGAPPVLAWLATGLPVMLLITMASVLLAIVGCALWPNLATASIGGAAAALAVGLATYGVRFTGFSWVSRQGAHRGLESV